MRDMTGANKDGDRASDAFRTAADKVYSTLKDRLLTGLVSATCAGVTFVALWAYAKSVVVLNDDQVRKVAEQMVGKLDFAATVAALAGVPVGSIVAWPSKAKPPDGWEVCDGREVTAGRDDRIWQVLEATYGKANNGMVKLPDFSGRFLRGVGEMTSMVGTAQADAVGPHAHEVMLTQSGFKGGTDGNAKMLRTDTGLATNPSSTALPMAPPRGGAPSETRPINYAVYWIIRVR